MVLHGYSQHNQFKFHTELDFTGEYFGMWYFSELNLFSILYGSEMISQKRFTDLWSYRNWLTIWDFNSNFPLKEELYAFLIELKIS